MVQYIKYGTLNIRDINSSLFAMGNFNIEVLNISEKSRSRRRIGSKLMQKLVETVYRCKHCSKLELEFETLKS